MNPHSMTKNRIQAASLMSGIGPIRGFSPGASVSGVKTPPIFTDAADLLLDSDTPEPLSGADGLLLLADGTRYRGRLFGAPVVAEGELVFTTGMTGYQESLKIGRAHV